MQILLLNLSAIAYTEAPLHGAMVLTIEDNLDCNYGDSESDDQKDNVQLSVEDSSKNAGFVMYPFTAKNDYYGCAHTEGYCMVAVHAKDRGTRDKGNLNFCLGVKIGSYLTNSYKNNFLKDASLFKTDGGCVNRDLDYDECASLGCGDLKSVDGNEYICSVSSQWTECSSTTESAVTIVNGNIYVCKASKWVFDDKDHDGYVGTIDDKDDSAPASDCPTLSDEDLLRTSTVDEIRQAMLAKCNADRVKFSTCSSCKNPTAPEVCGDTVDNDGNSETSENCNENQYACTQEAPPVLEDGTQPVTPLNIYNQPFAWIDFPDQPNSGYCCGYQGANDLGKMLPEQTIGQTPANSNLKLYALISEITFLKFRISLVLILFSKCVSAAVFCLSFFCICVKSANAK